MPAWLKDAVFYEIYPQSFMDANGDGIGDFEGIVRRLDYIKALGCNAIWMNPCFDSPFGDAGYDVADYYAAAPRYGTNEDLRRLFEEAHRRGMHVLLDLVTGHTSIEHPWFKASQQAERNEFTDRYVWTDSVWTTPENMFFLRGIFARHGACVTNFFSNQPSLNYGFYKPDPAQPWQQPMDAPGPRATLQEMMNVMRFWLTMGCDGFRVDMASSLVKNDDEAAHGNIALWQEVRAFLDREFPEAAMVSEWGEPDKSLLAGFHMDFLLHIGPSRYTDLFRCEEPFFCKRGKGDAAAFVAKYEENVQKSGGQGLICIPSGNHDIDRLARLRCAEEIKIAFAFLLTMPGAPFIYYGDEIGMRYIEGLSSLEGGYNRTGSRSPMQWDDSVNAGFSAAAPDRLYLPLDAQKDRPTAKAQQDDPHSIYAEVKKLIALRRATPALGNQGGIRFIHAKPQTYPLAYLRTAGEETLLVVVNPADREEAFPCEYAVKDVLYQVGGSIQVKDGEAAVPPCCACVCRV